MFEGNKVYSPSCFSEEVSYGLGTTNLFILNHGRKKNMATIVITVLETPVDMNDNSIDINAYFEFNDKTKLNFSLGINEKRSFSVSDFYTLHFAPVGDSGTARLKIDTHYFYITEVDSTLLCLDTSPTALESSITLNYTEQPENPIWLCHNSMNNVTLRISRARGDVDIKITTRNDGVRTIPSWASSSAFFIHAENLTQVELLNWLTWGSAVDIGSTVEAQFSINQIVEE